MWIWVELRVEQSDDQLDVMGGQNQLNQGFGGLCYWQHHQIALHGKRQVVYQFLYMNCFMKHLKNCVNI